MNRQQRRPRWRRVDGIVLLDKPLGLSSNEALQRVRRLFNAEKAGHTGALDPLATGLLPICLGEATKLCGVLLEGDKRYHASIALGVSTTTGDAEGQERARSDARDVGVRDFDAVLPRFHGAIQQIPPMYSAIKHQGRPLYALARDGQEIERAARTVQIHRLEVLSCAQGRLELDVLCSKGTYIRTLAEDLAAAIGQQAHLTGLRRLAAQPFDEASPMLTLEFLQAAADRGFAALDDLLLPPAAGLRHWPSWQADDTQLSELSFGRSVSAGAAHLAPGRLAVLDDRGRLRGMARMQASGVVAPERWFLLD